jgi:hypothetical protein
MAGIGYTKLQKCTSRPHPRYGDAKSKKKIPNGKSDQIGDD